MFWQTVAFSAYFLGDASATPQAGGGNSGSADFLRFGCSQLVVERTDPLVNPGLLPSPHMHQVVGGNSFNVTMDPDSIDPPETSTCTSCIYTEDTSNYWTASIYFKSPENGTYKRVPQMANGRLNNTLLEQDGGLTIYYMRPFSGDKCPSTHPVRIPQVMYEIMYDTRGAMSDPKYFKDGKQPLVYSFGDTTGYGAHGDYLFGWKGDALQRAMDNLGKGCASEDCTKILKIQAGKDAIACRKEQQAHEDVGNSNWLTEIPGNVQAQ
ncbi:hypothetical protein SLS60_009071 [Paraconiothyrium brasiliense]|uniref:DUF1996 domain-containing protein n=1 Tax=Paraconiothyrium brasiliense TaxID=300254 RepID=A0ABR3QW82_9PLEO